MWAHYLRGDQPSGWDAAESAAPQQGVGHTANRSALRNGGSPKRRRASAAEVASTPEIQRVVDRYSQQRLFDSDDALLGGMPSVGQLLARPLPVVLKRPPVVEWLLTSKDGTASEQISSPPSESPPTTNGGDRRKCPASENDASDAYEITAQLLDALEAMHATQVVEESHSTKQPSATELRTRTASLPMASSGASGNQRATSAVQPIVPSVGPPAPRHLERSETPLAGTPPGGTASSVSTPVRGDVPQFPGGEKQSHLPLSSASFARLGVLPPRTGSSESMDQIGQPREFDMEAVRRALQGGQNDDRCGSPHPAMHIGQSSGSPRRSPQPRHAKPLHIKARSIASSERDISSFMQLKEHGHGRTANVAALVAELGQDDIDLLQRGFSDLTKRRSACDMRKVTGRLFDASSTKKKR